MNLSYIKEKRNCKNCHVIFLARERSTQKYCCQSCATQNNSQYRKPNIKQLSSHKAAVSPKPQEIAPEVSRLEIISAVQQFLNNGGEIEQCQPAPVKSLLDELKLDDARLMDGIAKQQSRWVKEEIKIERDEE